MAIITISRGSYGLGKEIAEKTAAKLGYECVGRGEVVNLAAERYGIPHVKLVRAIEDAPGILQRFGYTAERYCAYFQSVLLSIFKEDNIVYHGLAGHYFVRDVPHVLKTRVTAPIEDRVTAEMKREGISEREAYRIITRDDKERRRWSEYLYGIDIWDSSNFDMVFHLKTIGADDVVDMICNTLDLGLFVTTEQSQHTVDDLSLACAVRAALMETEPSAEVDSDEGNVVVRLITGFRGQDRVLQDVREIASKVPGVQGVDIELTTPGSMMQLR